MDSVTDRALKCGAALLVHAYPDGRAPGLKRIHHLGLQAAVIEAPGTSEDVALWVAYEKGARLIVAVGTHSNIVDFLEKGRKGMASTFLVRLKVGSILIDAKGVSHLYPWAAFSALHCASAGRGFGPLAPRTRFVRNRAAMVHTVCSELAPPVGEINLLAEVGLERVITILVDIRYHLTSLVAVFLSLGLGMVIGMSLAEDDTLRREQQNLIRSIEERVSMVQAENAHLLAQLDEVQTSLGDYERLIWDAGGQLFGRSLQDVQVTIVAEAAFHPAIEPWVKFLQLHGGEVRQLTWHRDRLTESAAGAADVAASGAEPYAALGRALAGMIWGEEVDQTLEALVASGVFHLDGAPAARGKPDIIVFVPDSARTLRGRA